MIKQHKTPWNIELFTTHKEFSSLTMGLALSGSHKQLEAGRRLTEVSTPFLNTAYTQHEVTLLATVSDEKGVQEGVHCYLVFRTTGEISPPHPLLLTEGGTN